MSKDDDKKLAIMMPDGKDMGEGAYGKETPYHVGSGGGREMSPPTGSGGETSTEGESGKQSSTGEDWPTDPGEASTDSRSGERSTTGEEGPTNEAERSPTTSDESPGEDPGDPSEDSTSRRGGYVTVHVHGESPGESDLAGDGVGIGIGGSLDFAPTDAGPDTGASTQGAVEPDVAPPRETVRVPAAGYVRLAPANAWGLRHLTNTGNVTIKLGTIDANGRVTFRELLRPGGTIDRYSAGDAIIAAAAYDADGAQPQPADVLEVTFDMPNS